ARAHIRPRKRRRDRAVVEQVARMRDHDVARIAAVDLDADLARLGAEMLVAAPAERAGAAADPWIDDVTLPRTDGDGFRPDGLDRAFDFMPEREGQRPAAGELRLA